MLGLFGIGQSTLEPLNCLRLGGSDGGGFQGSCLVLLISTIQSDSETTLMRDDREFFGEDGMGCHGIYLD